MPEGNLADNEPAVTKPAKPQSIETTFRRHVSHGWIEISTLPVVREIPRLMVGGTMDGQESCVVGEVWWHAFEMSFKNRGSLIANEL